MKIAKERIQDIQNKIENEIGISAHLIISDYHALIKGINSDPLFELMMSRYVSMKRWLIKKKRMPDYRKLDIYLLRSKNFDKNFDYLDNRQKYEFIRNLIAIKLFIEGNPLNYNDP